jgi:peroxiredoxin
MFHRAVPAAALVLSSLPLLTSPLAGKDTPDKLIREISHQLQSAGPSQFSLLTLDARLTAAHELSGQIPEESRKLLNGVRADLKQQGFATPPDEFIYRMVECLMTIDYEEAAKVALESDAPDALTPLVRYRMQKMRGGGALDLVVDRIKKGGFHIAPVSDVLPELEDSRDQTDILIQSLLRNFPSGKATWIDCRLALDWAAMLIPRHNEAASALLQAILREASDPQFAARVTSTTREDFQLGEKRLTPDRASDCIVIEAAGLLRAIDEEAFHKFVPALGSYGEAIDAAGPMEALTAVRNRRTRTVSVMNLPPASADAYRAGMRDVASLEPEEAAPKIAQIQQDDARVLVQIALLERGLTGDLRTETLQSALGAATKLSDETLRIRSLSRLVRQAGADRKAVAAAALAASDALAVYCKSAVADEPRTWTCADSYNELAAAIGSADMEDDFKSPALAPYLLLVKLHAHLGDLLDFTLKDVDSGEKVRLMDLRGKVVLLDFWATWCGPCRRELPTVEKLHRELKDKGLVVLTINDESPAKARSFVHGKKYTFPVLDDSKREVHARYHVHAIPTLVVFDKKGKMVSYSTGTKGEESLRRLLARAGL